MAAHTDIHLASLREAFRRYEASLRWAIASSLVFVILSLDPSTYSESSSFGVLPVPVRLSSSTWALLAFFGQFVSAMLAFSAMSHVYRGLD